MPCTRVQQLDAPKTLLPRQTTMQGSRLRYPHPQAVCTARRCTPDSQQLDCLTVRFSAPCPPLDSAHDRLICHTQLSRSILNARQLIRSTLPYLPALVAVTTHWKPLGGGHMQRPPLGCCDTLTLRVLVLTMLLAPPGEEYGCGPLLTPSPARAPGSRPSTFPCFGWNRRRPCCGSNPTRRLRVSYRWAAWTMALAASWAS